MVENNCSSKIYCKDSRNMSEIKNESISLIITSPPYYNLKNYNGNHEINNQLGNPKSYEEYIQNLNSVWDECVRILHPDGKLCINIMPIFLTGDQTHFKRRVTKTAIMDIESYFQLTKKMFLQALYIWDKRKIVRFSSFGSYPYPPNIFSTFPYEWIIVFSKKGKRSPVSKEIKEKSKITTKEWQDWAINSIWEMQPAKAKEVGHPAPFPEELPKRLIKLYSFVGDIVLDPFMGSGTTLLAAINLERNAIGYELNPDYIKLAKRRISNINLRLF